MQTGRSRLQSVIGILLLTAAFGNGQGEEGGAPPQPSPPKDFSKGFDQLFALGLPEPSGEYVATERSRYGTFSEIGMKGGGWKLESPGKVEGSAVIVTLEGERQEIIDRRAGQALLERLRKQWRDEGKSEEEVDDEVRRYFAGVGWGEAKPADAKEDADRLADGFTRQEGAEESRILQMVRYGSQSGEALIAAAYFYKAGFKDQANRAAAGLFAAAENPESIIDSAIGILAEREYNRAVNAFFSEGEAQGDWGKLSDALGATIAKFPRGWRNLGAVRLLAQKVAARPPQPPELTAEGLSDTHRKLAAQIANDKSGQLYIPDSIGWLAGAVDPEDGGEGGSLTAEITKLRLDAIPMLAALIGDETLTHIDSRYIRRGSFSYSSDDDTESEAFILEAFKSMRRPATRGEFAEAFLRSIIPDESEDTFSREEPLPEETQENSLKFYADHKDKSPTELALFYLQNGGSSQKVEAITSLLESGDEHLEVIENYYLDPDSPIEERIWSVDNYVEKRGKEAAAFLDKLQARIDRELKDDPDADESDRQQYAQMMEQLRRMASGEGVAELVAKALAGEVAFQAVANQIYELLESGDPAANTAALLRGAAEAPDAGLAQSFLSLVGYVPHAAPGEEADGAEEGDEEPPMPTLQDNAELWTKLLGDERAKFSQMVQGNLAVADSAAIAINQIGAPADLQAIGGLIQMVGFSAVSETLRTRAAEILEGKPADELTAMPAAESVDAAARDALSARLMALEGAALGEAIRSLPAAERLALAEMAGDGSDAANALAAKLGSVANQIASVQVAAPAGAEPEIGAMLKARIGDTFSKADVEALVEAGKQVVAAGDGIVVMATRRPGFGGFEISITRADPAEGGDLVNFFYNAARRSGEGTGSLNGQIQGGAAQGSAMWRVDLTPAAVARLAERRKDEGETDEDAAPEEQEETPADPDALEDSDRLEEESSSRSFGPQPGDDADFWKAVEDSLTSEEDRGSGANLYLYGAPAGSVPEDSAPF